MAEESTSTESTELSEEAKKSIKNEMADNFVSLLDKHKAKMDEKLGDYNEKLEEYGAKLDEIGASTEQLQSIQDTLKKLSESVGTVEKLKETFQPKSKEEKKRLKETLGDDEFYLKDKVLDAVEDRILQEKEELIKVSQTLAEQIEELKAEKNGDALTKEKLVSLLREDAELKGALSPFIEEKGKLVTRQVLDDNRFYEEVETLEKAGVPKPVQQTVVNYFDALAKSDNKEKAELAKSLTSISAMVDEYAKTDEGKWVKNLLAKGSEDEEFTVKRLLNRHKVPLDPGVGAEDFAEPKTQAAKASEALRLMMQHTGSRSDDILRNN